MHHKKAVEIRELFLKGTLTAGQIVEKTFANIEKNDPKVRAFISLSHEKAKKQAEALDSAKEQGQPLGRLAGVPIAVKDNIHVMGEISTCGSKFLTNYRAPFQATAIDLLEKEGAIIVGKTNCDEFAMGSSTENSAIQPTYNPWNLKCVPGGSSGGSAAAVSAGFVPMALGSDTGGSIRQPASFCGTVGFKPSYGRVSRFGLVAYGSSLDQIGPMTNSVEDAALIMEIMGAPCSRDSTSMHKPNDEIVKHLNKGIAGMKIGVPWSFLDKLDSEPLNNFKNSLEILKSLGAQIVDVNLEVLKYSIPVYYILATAEASTNLARFDGIRYGLRSAKAKTLDEVYELSKEEGFGTEVKRRILLGTYVLSAGFQDAYYRKAQKVRTLIVDAYKHAFKSADIIAMPSTPFDAFEMGAIKDPVQMYLEDIYTIGVNLAGLPAISIPSGFSKRKLPLGLQLIAPFAKDGDVFPVAAALEKAFALNLVPPSFDSTGV